MTERMLTGTRVRNRRLDRGLRQADVARQVGISGSYLNLIEHNRRRIGSKLLGDLARVLEIDPALLETGAAEAMLGPLKEAAAGFPEAIVEDGRADEFLARFPGWASLIAAQHARIAQLQGRVESLSNRLAHDTQIANSLHEVISTATAIRSTASILVESPDLDRDWQSRFHTNIDTDSARLSESSQALLGLLDMEMDAGEAAAEASPLEQAEVVMAQAGFDLEAVEERRAAMADPAVREILQGWAEMAAADAAAMPAEAFAQAARAVAYDPARLAERFGAPLEAVLRRLASLPATDDHPPMGLAICDAAGVITFQKPILDFRLPRSGAACPLWPIYQALTQPGRALRRVVRLPGAARTPFECFAIAAPAGAVAFGAEPRVVSTMLVRPARSDEVPGQVGPGCRFCAVEGCASRRHPSLL